MKISLTLSVLLAGLLAFSACHRPQQSWHPSQPNTTHKRGHNNK